MRSAVFDLRPVGQIVTATHCSIDQANDQRPTANDRRPTTSDYNGCFHHRERGFCMSSGQLAEVATGVVKPREEWIARRRGESARATDENVSQMHFARQGVITEEMAYVARRERIAP